MNKAIAEDVPPMFDYLEGQLELGPWFTGKMFSVGDIAVASQLVNFGHAGYRSSEALAQARGLRAARAYAGVIHAADRGGTGGASSKERKGCEGPARTTRPAPNPLRFRPLRARAEIPSAGDGGS